MIQQRDAKGHFLPVPGGPTAKMRALEAQVRELELQLQVKIGQHQGLSNIIQQISGTFGDSYQWERLPAEVATLAQRCEAYGQKAERMGEANTALIQERDNWLADFNRCADSLRDAELTIERQAKIIANLSSSSTKEKSHALPVVIMSVICGAMCGGIVAKHPAVPVAPWWLIVAGIILFVVVAAVAVLAMGAASAASASLDPEANGEDEAR